MSNFLEDLDAMFRDAGIDPETFEVPDDSLSEHSWISVQVSVFENDPYEWKCKRCGRTITIGKVYPPEPSEPDYSSITDENEIERLSKEYDRIMDEYGKTKESLSRIETINEALERENVNLSCGLEIATDIHSR